MSTRSLDVCGICVGFHPRMNSAPVLVLVESCNIVVTVDRSGLLLSTPLGLWGERALNARKRSACQRHSATRGRGRDSKRGRVPYGFMTPKETARNLVWGAPLKSSGVSSRPAFVAAVGRTPPFAAASDVSRHCSCFPAMARWLDDARGGGRVHLCRPSAVAAPRAGLAPFGPSVTILHPKLPVTPCGVPRTR